MLRLIGVPYHLGRVGVGMGAGPLRLLAAGATDALRRLGHDLEIEDVERGAAFAHEVGAHFAVLASVSRSTSRAVDEGAFPFVLGGNCSTVLGVVAGTGLGARGGVVWFDAHADANTPETTETGFLDGMPVAVLVGRCWSRLAAGIPAFVPLPEDRVLLAGVRDVDESEQRLVSASGMSLVGPDGVGGEGTLFCSALDALAKRVDSVHVHVDLDVIDTSDGYANEFACSGGPRLDDLLAAIRSVRARCAVNSVSLTSFNPDADSDGRALASALRIVGALGELVPVVSAHREGGTAR
ncbi:MAG TPA: arginase family protein [Actinomycetales bacterium]|nr:arginase family protein [Actinomycetales bacterium]